ncbi:MAG: hypothetical protein IM607_12325 [Cytophagales bacterium]|jgi:hypothetical protein|nr:hypothetical protein [Cytophagales bacterium]
MTKDIATQVAVLATRMQAVEDTLHEGIKKVEGFTQKTIDKETEVALLVQQIAHDLRSVRDSIAGMRNEIDTHKATHEKRLKTNEQKTNIALVWLAFLTIFVFALLLFIASGSSGARVAGEFTGGLINSVKP